MAFFQMNSFCYQTSLYRRIIVRLLLLLSFPGSIIICSHHVLLVGLGMKLAQLQHLSCVVGTH